MISIKLGNTREKGADNEIRNFFIDFVTCETFYVDGLLRLLSVSSQA